MIKASKAIEIGDKLYNLERMHGKIISLTKSVAYGKEDQIMQLNQFIEFAKNLKELVECMAKDLDGKFISNYLNAIQQVINRTKYIDSLIDHDLFTNCCFLHGTFIKFRKKIRNILTRGCEIDFQKVCTPLLLIELQRKSLKKSIANNSY